MQRLCLAVLLAGTFWVGTACEGQGAGKKGIPEAVPLELGRRPDGPALALMERSFVPLVPAWAASAEPYALPDWFSGRRVQLHTRLPLGPSKQTPGAAKLFREMGARVVVRHIKSGSEAAWWPSRVGDVIDEARAGRNLAQEIIDDAHAQGLRIIVYYRHIEDDWAAEHHPEWRCLDCGGNPIRGTRGIHMCMNSPYADYVLTRQLELAAMGADGLFYDSTHMPRVGCWCKSCREKFTALTGLQHPEKADVNDPVWHKLKQFNNASIGRTFATWRTALHGKNPNLVMVVGSNFWPGLNDQHMDQRVFRTVDSHKTEYNKGLIYRKPKSTWPLPPSLRPQARDVRLAMGYDVSRDVTGGRPAHVWAHNLRSEPEALAVSAGIVGHGCIANLHVEKGRLPDRNLCSSFRLGDSVSPWLVRRAPLRTVAILHSELARDRRGLELERLWRDVLYPEYAAYHVLLRDRVPVGFLFDGQLEEGRLDNVGAVFVPDKTALTETMQRQLRIFQAKGGLVVFNTPAWQWHEAAGWDQAVKRFRAAMGPAYAAAPVRAAGGGEALQMTVFQTEDCGSLTVCLINDFSWARVGGRGEEGEDDTSEAEPLESRPAPCTGASLTLRAIGGQSPRRIVDVATGRELRFKKHQALTVVDLEPFQELAVAVVDYGGLQP